MYSYTKGWKYYILYTPIIPGSLYQDNTCNVFFLKRPFFGGQDLISDSCGEIEAWAKFIKHLVFEQAFAWQFCDSGIFVGMACSMTLGWTSLRIRRRRRRRTTTTTTTKATATTTTTGWFDRIQCHFAKEKSLCMVDTHRIHIWYICLHVPYKSTIHVGNYSIHGSFGIGKFLVKCYEKLILILRRWGLKLLQNGHISPQDNLYNSHTL